MCTSIIKRFSYLSKIKTILQNKLLHASVTQSHRQNSAFKQNFTQVTIEFLSVNKFKLNKNFCFVKNSINLRVKFALKSMPAFNASVCTGSRLEENDHTAVPHERPCGVKQIFSSSPVDELTGDSARSSCSAASCSL